jgi:hypothetical protein
LDATPPALTQLFHFFGAGPSPLASLSRAVFGFASAVGGLARTPYPDLY